MMPLLITIGAAAVLFTGIMVFGYRQTKREEAKGRVSAVMSRQPVQVDKAGNKKSGALERKLRQLEKEQKESLDNQKQSLEDKIQEAGWSINIQTFWVLSVLSMGFCFSLALILSFSNLVLYASLPIGFWGLPRGVLNFARAKRRKKFVNDLADALESIVRGIKSGLPVTEAMAMIGRDFDGPVAVEFNRCVDEQALGLTVGETLQRLAKRMPLPEVRMMAIAITIQSKTGGSLAETLSNLADVIRGRHRLKRKVTAVSQEAKVSAAIIGCLPVVVAGGMYAVNPEHMMLLFTHPTGKVLVIGCAIWMSLGIFSMYNMVNFKV